MAPEPDETPEPPADREADPPSPDAPPEPGGVPAPAAPSEDWSTRFKYLYADFENYRRRTERSREEARREARRRLLESFLPLWEGFERAREAARTLPPKDPLRAGLELLRAEWDRFFELEGIEPVARIGEPFRTEEHEAVGELPATARVTDGMVAEVVQQGYRSRDGLVRAAKVLVARRPIPPPATEAPAPSAAEEP